MNTSAVRSVVFCGLIIAMTGCSHYYRVTDPGSGKTYYTQDINNERGGAIKIKDGRTQSTVTLQSSEVREISAEEYEGAIQTQPPVVIQPSVTTQPR